MRPTVNDILNVTWYVQPVVILTESGESVLFTGENYKTRSEQYKPLLSRYVESIGVDDGYLRIKVI